MSLLLACVGSEERSPPVPWWSSHLPEGVCQQWDYPNAWPPLQHMLIDGRHGPQQSSTHPPPPPLPSFWKPEALNVACPGLSKVPSEEAKQLAFELAQRWIRSNWLAYTKHAAMFEKVRPSGAFGSSCCAALTLTGHLGYSTTCAEKASQVLEGSTTCR